MPDPTTAARYDLGVILAAELVAQDRTVYWLSNRSGVPLTTCQRVFRPAGRKGTLHGVLMRLLGAMGRDLAWLHDQGVTPPPPASG